MLFFLYIYNFLIFFSMACLTFSLSSLAERIFESLPYVSADCPGFQFSCRFHGSIWTSPLRELRWLTDLGGVPQVRRIQYFRMVGIVGIATFSFAGSNPLVNRYLTRLFRFQQFLPNGLHSDFPDYLWGNPIEQLSWRKTWHQCSGVVDICLALLIEFEEVVHLLDVVLGRQQAWWTAPVGRREQMERGMLKNITQLV